MTRSLIATLAFALLAACATESRLPEAQQLIASGHIEEGLAVLRREMESDPRDIRARTRYFEARDRAVVQLLAEAEQARAAGLLPQAEASYRRVLEIEPGHAQARAGLDLLRREARYAKIIASAEAALKAGELEAAAEALRPVLAEDPSHRAARALQMTIDERRVSASLAPPQLSAAVARKTISLEFREVPLRSVLEVITRAAGVNFVLDKDVRPDSKVTIFVRDRTVGDVIDMLLITNQLAKKIQDDATVLVYPNTPQKQKDYQELTVKSFYLANADPKQTLSLIRAIVKTRDVFVDEKLGLLVMRDTPEAIRLAERLIAAQDLAEPEVVLAVEVLEVGRNKLLDLGVRWPDQVAYSLVGGAPAGAAAGTTGTPGQFTLREWLNRDSGMVRINVTNPAFIVNLRQQDGQTTLLANPKIRVRNHEKAKVHIGERVPVITSTGTAGGFVSQSVTYLDVGLKLEVEPQIYLRDEVGIKVGLEVSNIVREVTTASTTGSTLTYQIGTRNASTVLRLADGETQVLAGLITDEDRRTANRVPGLGEFPVIGRLFSNHSSNATRNEIVLLVTPRIVRALVRPEAHITEFPSGTESGMGVAGGTPPPPLPATPPTTRPIEAVPPRGLQAPAPRAN